MSKFDDILNAELIESMGCTEPAAIAFAVAFAKEKLNTLEKVESVSLMLSSNMLKNALCVTIPNTNQSGVEMIVALSLNKCKSNNRLTILSEFTDKDVENAQRTLKDVKIEVGLAKNSNHLYICANVCTKNHNVKVEIEDKHDEIKTCEKDGFVIFKKALTPQQEQTENNNTYEELLDYIENENMNSSLLNKIKEYNLDIANYGLENKTGLGIGKTLSHTHLFDEKYRSVIAKTVAGIDSRMGGVGKKVYINSGSGNQGITATVPVVEMAKILKVSKAQELKALALSHLTAIHIRSKQGRLSSACGAVCACGGVAAAVTYLLGGTRKQIQGAVLNLLCSNFGVFCDGAKSTCALKVASALSAAFASAFLAKEDVYINSNLGVISQSLDETLSYIAKIENKLTTEMDKTILETAIDNALNANKR